MGNGGGRLYSPNKVKLLVNLCFHDINEFCDFRKETSIFN